MIVGAILIALSPISCQIASTYLRNAYREYFSVVTIEIKPDISSRAHSAGLDDSWGGIDSQFRATQIQRIQMAEILTPVIEKLDLVKKFSPPGTTMPTQQVVEMLLRSVVVQEQKSTTLVEIGVYHADKQLAGDIANNIAITYRDKRIEDLRKNEEQTLAEMKDELRTKEEEMKKLFLETRRIRQEDNIVDPDPESASVSLTFSAGRALGGVESTRMNLYAAKKAAYLAAKQLLLGFQRQYDQAGVSGCGASPVKIWQRAETAQTSARPNEVAILHLANAIGGSLTGVGALLILIGVCIPSRKLSQAEAQQ